MADEDEYEKEKQREEFLRSQQKTEQGATWLAETFPSLWRRMFLNLCNCGFDKDQVFELLKVFITTSCAPK